MRWFEIDPRGLLVAVLLIALTAVGFAHRMPTAQNISAEAYVLAGGSLADLCSDSDGMIAGADCPACHLVGAAALPEPQPAIRDADLIFVAEVVAPRESRALSMVLDPARGLRAPPRT